MLRKEYPNMLESVNSLVILLYKLGKDIEAKVLFQ